MEPQYEEQEQASPPRSWDSGTVPGGVATGVFAVLVGLLLIAAFFMPWAGAVWGGDQSGFDMLKEGTGSDNTLGNLLLDFLVASPALAGLGGVVFGLGLVADAMGEGRGAAFRSWAATSIGGMVVWAAFWPCFLWTTALLAHVTSNLKIGLWLSLVGAVLLAITSLKGLFSAEPFSRNGWAPSLSGYGGAFAVVLGVILLIAFFLPWAGGESAYDAVKQDLEADSFLGELLYKLIFASTALAGLGSVIFGLRLATRSGSNAAYKAWAATSVGGMAALAIMLPCFMWSGALIGGYSDELEFGFWITLIGALLLTVASLMGLVDASAAQREEV
jgi:hypothetical protein